MGNPTSLDPTTLILKPHIIGVVKGDTRILGHWAPYLSAFCLDPETDSKPSRDMASDRV